jgi:hypothetical protein
MTEIFVFGSNLAGRHGKGAARYALDYHGAIYGKGVGIQGDSYAIPTKDKQLKPLPLREIRGYINGFISFACRNPDVTFNLTPVGCGLAGYKQTDIFPMVAHRPNNVKLTKEWALND